jgi:hypothetical protein
MAEKELTQQGKDEWQWVKEQLQKLHNEFNKQFPKAGKGRLNYLIFNSMKWE